MGTPRSHQRFQSWPDVKAAHAARPGPCTRFGGGDSAVKATRGNSPVLTRDFDLPPVGEPVELRPVAACLALRCRVERGPPLGRAPLALCVVEQ